MNSKIRAMAWTSVLVGAAIIAYLPAITSGHEIVTNVKSFEIKYRDGVNILHERRKLGTNETGISVNLRLENEEEFNCVLKNQISVTHPDVKHTLRNGDKLSSFECETAASFYDVENNCVFSFFTNGNVHGIIFNVENDVVYSIDQHITEPLVIHSTTIDEEADGCGEPEDANAYKEKLREAAESNIKPHRNLLERWTNCYPGDELGKTLSIGIAVGSETIKNNGGVCDVYDSVIGMLAETNFVYRSQFNVNLLAKEFYFIDPENQGSTLFDNKGCTKTISEQFNDFRDWKPQKEASAQGHWHLIDDCRKSGDPIGIAYVGAMCDDLFNVGITYKPSTPRQWSSAWLTFAHELGHQFGMKHSFEEGTGTTGGIMDYGDKKLDGQYQFNKKYRKDELCGKLTSEVEKKCPFLNDPVFTCGNKELEAGEECECEDGSSECACCKNCKLKGLCSPFGNPCCTDQCTYADTRVPCQTFQKEDGYCAFGVCAHTICNIVQGTFCGIHDDNSCKLKCKVGNTCTKMNGWTVGGNPINNVDNGVTCEKSTGGYGTCQDGVCQGGSGTSIAPTNFPTTKVPTPKPTTNSPTPLPTNYPSNFPTTIAPTPEPTTKFPTPLPTTNYPTPFPAVQPTSRPLLISNPFLPTDTPAAPRNAAGQHHARPSSPPSSFDCEKQNQVFANLATMNINNLCGTKSASIDPVLKYKNALVIDNHEYDIEIGCESQYDISEASKSEHDLNTPHSKTVGKITMNRNSKLSLSVKFFESSSGHAATLNNVTIHFFDMDGFPEEQKVKVCNADSFTTGIRLKSRTDSMCTTVYSKPAGSRDIKLSPDATKVRGLKAAVSSAFSFDEIGQFSFLYTVGNAAKTPECCDNIYFAISALSC